MLSQDTLGHVADKIGKRFSGVETLVLTTVAKRIREIGEVLPSDATALARLTNIGSDISTITLYFQQQTGLAASEIQQPRDGDISHMPTMPHYSALWRPKHN